MAKAKSKRTPGVNAEEQAKLDAVMASVHKQFGENTLMIMDRPPSMNRYAHQTPSGSIGLDIAIGPMYRKPNGFWQTGVMPGTISEIIGPESSGKTTLVLLRIANAQKMGLRCALLDMEHTFDPHYARALGVDLSTLWIGQPKNGEECLDIAKLLIKSGVFHVVAIDSVAALVPKDEIEGDIGESHMGKQARMMSQFMRMIVGVLGSESKTEIIFVNQIRHKIGRFMGSPETTPGGNALKFYATFRFDVRKIKSVTASGETDDDMSAAVIGHRMRVKVIKNKVAPPFRFAEFSLIYGIGIHYLEELVDLCTSNGIMTLGGGGWYTMANGQKFQGKKQLCEHLKLDRVLTYNLYDQLLTTNLHNMGFNADGSVIPEMFTGEQGVAMHKQFEPPTDEERALMAGQEELDPNEEN